MTARLRVLPIYNGERGQHYLILDNVGDVPLRTEDVDRIRAAVDATVLVLGFPVDLPGVDEDPEGAWAEMVRAEHAREQAYKAAHWEADPDTPGAVRKREAATPASAPEEPEDVGADNVTYQELAEESARAEEPSCKALREVEHSGWVACDGTGHDRDYHSGRLTAGPFVGQRWVWPFASADRAKLLEAPVFTVTVNAADTSQDVARQVRRALREHAAISVRRA